MKVNFESGRSATVGEKKLYSQMTEMKFEESQPGIDFWKDTIDFGNKAPKIVRCIAMYSFLPDFSVSCVVGKRKDEYPIFPRWDIPKKDRVAEIRYGDVDRDGDIDIAIKLMGGAIYIFQNSDK
ncbi:MAG: hypothetical protein Q7T03_06575 [Deltaproteobacteria bacterium]|nr:hypothetical protein [Deltaproteobacteria bacterium]